MHVFERSPLGREEKQVCYLSLPSSPLPSLKSLVSDCTEWITSFNNDVNLSITWATNLGSLKEKWDILEKFTAL